jgi:uridine kinase
MNMTEEKIQIYCKNTGTYRHFRPGVTLQEIYDGMDVRLPYLLTSARVNNKTENLHFRCYMPKDVEFLDIRHPSALRTYVRSLCFVLSKAVYDLYKIKVYIEHPVSKGYYCELALDRPIVREDVEAIKQRMSEIIRADRPFIVKNEQTSAIVDLFREQQMEDKALLLETSGTLYDTYQELDEYADYYHGTLLPSTGSLYLFGLEPFYDGLLLRIPCRENPAILEPFVKQDKMMAVFQEDAKLLRVLGLKNAGDLNLACREEGRASAIVNVAEALQEKIIAKIAETIAEKHKQGTKVVLISGPSSSGKTTFCQRLQVQLMTNRLSPVGISLDDYYLNRVDTPLTASGDYDFESLYAIDLPKFNEDLKKLLQGEKISLPTYDFTQGKRIYRGNTIQMKPGSVLVMEGIHALNPDLLPEIPSEQTFKIYVSALTSISLDGHNWIPTTDNRLLRRIVRDYQFRKYAAKETISRWPSVRAGEDRWIFPFQENADAMFNSAMLYELAALRRQAEIILSEVQPNEAEYAEACRLKKLLCYFNYINTDELPGTSLLREFTGGSTFRY